MLRMKEQGKMKYVTDEGAMKTKLATYLKKNSG